MDVFQTVDGFATYQSNFWLSVQVQFQFNQFNASEVNPVSTAGCLLLLRYRQIFECTISWSNLQVTVTINNETEIFNSTTLPIIAVEQVPLDSEDSDGEQVVLALGANITSTSIEIATPNVGANREDIWIDNYSILYYKLDDSGSGTPREFSVISEDFRYG